MSSRSESIFKRVDLSAQQIRMVAQRRYEDAKFLLNTGSNARMNAAMYLGGFALECLLKARLLDKYSFLKRSVPTPLAAKDQAKLRGLIYQSHDLATMVDSLPELVKSLQRRDKEYQTNLAATLTQVCGEWTIFARYSPKNATQAEARRFLERIEELRKWLQ